MATSKYNDGQKLAAVASILAGDETAKEAAERLEVAPKTIRDWQEKFADEAAEMVEGDGDGEDGDGAPAEHLCETCGREVCALRPEEDDPEPVTECAKFIGPGPEPLESPVIVDCGKDSEVRGPGDIHRAILEAVAGLDAALGHEAPEGATDEQVRLARTQTEQDRAHGHTVLMGRAAWWKWTEADPDGLRHLVSRGAVSSKGQVSARIGVRFHPGLEDLMLVV